MRPMPPSVKASKNELRLVEDLHDGRPPYPGQKTWLAACLSPRWDTVVIACGRRVGKTTMIPRLFIEEMTGCKNHYQAAYMAQGHPQAKDMFRACLEAWGAGGLVEDSRADEGQDRWIRLHPINLIDADGVVVAKGHGATVYFISGEGGGRGFHGKGLDRAVIDEASLVPPEAYFLTLSPMLVTTNGKMLITGSPYPGDEGAVGWDWFKEKWESGNVLNPERDPTTISFNAPTEANPYNNVERVKKERAGCRSHAEQLCLYDGQFARDLGAVFINLDSVFHLKATDLGNAWQVEPRRPHFKYVAGLDFGARKDYSVLSIFSLEDHPRQVFLLRIQGEYHTQLGAIDKWLAEYDHPLLYVEGREGGRFIAPMLRQKYGEGCREVAWTTGGKWDKESSVLRGIDFFQQKAWSMIDVEWQREEFRLFSRIRRGPNSTGFKYEAPSGRHDDAVAATLYAAYGLPLVPAAKLELEPETKKYTREWWSDFAKAGRTLPTTNGPAQPV